MNIIIIILGGYLTIAFLIILALNHMTKGLVWAFLKVKMSMGKKVLAVCYDVTDTYFKDAEILGKELKVIPRDKQVHTFGKLSKDTLHKYMGVNAIDLNIPAGTIFNKDFESQTAYDLTNQDNAVNRALQLPRLGDKVEKIKLIILIIVLIGMGLVVYLMLQQPELIAEKVKAGVINYMKSQSVGQI